jgi:hypothetical protein
VVLLVGQAITTALYSITVTNTAIFEAGYVTGATSFLAQLKMT